MALVCCSLSTAQGNKVYVELLIVVVLTLINGLLAMSELAVVSARPARLKVMAADGNKGAAVALQLADDPGKFLSSVQIGITLVGILSGAFSGATLGDRLTGFLLERGLPDAVASTLGVGLVVMLPALALAFVVAGILHVVGAIKAYNGEWWNPPLTPRFVK